MLQRHAVAARKALRLDSSGLFGLLTLMTALLGVLLAGLGAGYAGSVLLYHAWQLDQQQEVTVTLMGDAAPDDVLALKAALERVPEVTQVQQLPEADIRMLLQDVLGEDIDLPLPSTSPIS